MKLGSNFRANMNPIKPNNVNSEDMEAAKQKGKSQLESQFPQTVNDPRGCGTRYVHVEINGNTYTVFGKPTYEHNITTGKYTLKSVEYTVEKGSKEMAGNDYLNNITESVPVTSETTLQELQNKQAEVSKQVSEKEKELQKLMDLVSGNGNEFQCRSFESIDSTSPEALNKLADQIENMLEYINELTIQIKQKNMEYQTLMAQCMNLRLEAKELDTEVNEKMQVYDDLCKELGVENKLKLKQMASLGKNDLTTRVNEYRYYIKMQKENLDTLNKEIDKLSYKSNTEDNASLEEFGQPQPGNNNSKNFNGILPGFNRSNRFRH